MFPFKTLRYSIFNPFFSCVFFNVVFSWENSSTKLRHGHGWPEDRLTEDYYAARLAGLAANCASTVAGISVSFSGYSAALAMEKWDGKLGEKLEINGNETCLKFSIVFLKIIEHLFRFKRKQKESKFAERECSVFSPFFLLKGPTCVIPVFLTAKIQGQWIAEILDSERPWIFIQVELHRG